MSQTTNSPTTSKIGKTKDDIVPNVFTASRGIGIDAASWALIQKLQAQDDDVDEERIASHNNNATGNDECRIDSASMALMQELLHADEDEEQRNRERKKADECIMMEVIALEEDDDDDGKVDVIHFEDTNDGDVVVTSTDSSGRLWNRKRPNAANNKRGGDTTTTDADMALAYYLQLEEDEAAAELHQRRRFPTKEQVLQTLTTCQRQAVEYVTKKAQIMHQNALLQLEKRVQSLGFRPSSATGTTTTTSPLQQCLDYIREDAPIIIHLTEQTLSLLLKDTHYRNLFETETSQGSTDILSRETWEATMFGGCYKKNNNGDVDTRCSAFDRPKYGCLNVTGDICGVASARPYGPLFFILHSSVRMRSTFFNQDTGGFVATNTLATHEYYAHILAQYSDDDLITALRISSNSDGASSSSPDSSGVLLRGGRIRGAPSAPTSLYKEVQIHGPVRLAEDIQALSVPGREQTASHTLRRNVLEFQKWPSVIFYGKAICCMPLPS